MEEIYVTLLEDLTPGQELILVKDQSNSHDDEAICALNMDYCDSVEEAKILKNIEDESNMSKIRISSDIIDDYTEANSGIYVANSVSTVARGTYSAGRLYDKFEKYVKVKVVFVLCGKSICKVEELC